MSIEEVRNTRYDRINYRLWRRMLLISLVYLITLPVPALPSFYDDLPDDQLIDEIMKAMTPEEMLGQVFFLGYVGKSPSGHIKRWIGERQVGGVKIFTRNIESLTSLAASIREMQVLALDSRLGIPLLIATDQEGGWVRHIRHGNSVSPGNMAIGAGGIPDDAFLTGYYLGMELRILGINMNFAPTVDVYSNPSATVVGPRAFSSDAVQTGLLALAYFKGMSKAGVISTAKHFPGHGDTDRDSHGYLPEVDITFEKLWERDLLPYRFLIKEGLPVIMDGHLAFPRILEEMQPSSLSPFFLIDVLRNMLEFGGVVITDDLEMYGVHQGELTLPEVSLKALEAGNDMILLSHTPSLQDRTWNELIALFYRNDKFRRRIEQAVHRILRLKLEYLKHDFPLLPDVGSIKNRIPIPEAEHFFFESSCRAVTLVRDGDIPYTPEDGEEVLLVGQLENFFYEGLRRFPAAEIYDYPYLPLEWSRRVDRMRVRELASRFSTMIFCLCNNNSLEVLEELEDYKGRLIVISTLSPIYLTGAPWIETALAVYGTGSDSFRAGFSVLFGDYSPEGTLPLNENLDINKISNSQYEP